MTRSEALAPLASGEARVPVTAGIAVRGIVRRAALTFGVDYYEEKGWLESTFVLRGPADQLRRMKKYLEQNI